MFELERLESKKGDTEKQYRYKLGSKGERTQIGHLQFTMLYNGCVNILRVIRQDFKSRSLPNVDDMYQGLRTMVLNPKVVRVKVVRGMVTEQTFEPLTLDLPPEDEVTPPETDSE